MTTPLARPDQPTIAPSQEEVSVPLPAGVGVAMAVAAVIIGILVLKLPVTTLVVIATLFGINLIFLGALRVALGLGRRDASGRVRGLTVGFGLLTFSFGIICLVSPGTSLGFVAILLAIGWISDGISAVIGGVRGRGERSTPGTLLSIASGAVSIIAGLIVAVAPGTSLVTLTLFSGILLIVLGISYLITAIAQHAGRSRTRG